jgi:hypothetical protein
VFDQAQIGAVMSERVTADPALGTHYTACLQAELAERQRR